MTQARTDTQTASGWSLFTPRGLALLYIARNPGCTKKELAEAIGVGERTATTIIGELTSTGAVRGTNGDGRRLHYEVNFNASVEAADGKQTTLRSMLNEIAR